jgi:hypothetical protein
VVYILNKTFKLLLFCSLLALCLNSCSKSYEPVVISEELLCEIQETFEGVNFGPYARPCETHLRLDGARFTYYSSSLEGHPTRLVVKMKGRYNYKPPEGHEDQKDQYALFDSYLKEMEKFGIKCIYVTTVLPKDTLVKEEPCNKITYIHFYADRISLKAIPSLENINLEDYQSVLFGMIPIHIRDSIYSSTIFPGTTWAFDLYGESNKNNESNDGE